MIKLSSVHLKKAFDQHVYIKANFLMLPSVTSFILLPAVWLCAACSRSNSVKAFCKDHFCICPAKVWRKHCNCCCNAPPPFSLLPCSPYLKKSPWCTVLRLLLSLQPLLPPQVYPTQQQRQPIRFAPLYSFLSLILQLWISALSFNQGWLHHHSTALLSLLKASSTHRASIELDSISRCFLISDYPSFYIRVFCSFASHFCTSLFTFYCLFSYYVLHRDVLWGQRHILMTLSSCSLCTRSCMQHCIHYLTL